MIIKNFVELRYNKGIALLRVQVFLVFTLLLDIGFILRIFARINHEGRFRENDKKEISNSGIISVKGRRTKRTLNINFIQFF